MAIELAQRSKVNSESILAHGQKWHQNGKNGQEKGKEISEAGYRNSESQPNPPPTVSTDGDKPTIKLRLALPYDLHSLSGAGKKSRLTGANDLFFYGEKWKIITSLHKVTRRENTTLIERISHVNIFRAQGPG